MDRFFFTELCHQGSSPTGLTHTHVLYTVLGHSLILSLCSVLRMDLIPFYARLVATLAPCMDDLAPMLVDNLIRNLRGQVRKKDQIHIHSKIKNCRFIGETPRAHVRGDSCMAGKGGREGWRDGGMEGVN